MLEIRPSQSSSQGSLSSGRSSKAFSGRVLVLAPNLTLTHHSSSCSFHTRSRTTPTASVFSVGTSTLTSHYTRNHAAYLFATVAGVSKVGSFTQSGATNVACGFTGDTPALIILKRTDSTGNWYLFDSVRGIVAGNDPHIYLDTTDAEITNADIVDPYSGGFATTANLTNGSYIFYAIAAIS